LWEAARVRGRPLDPRTLERHLPRLMRAARAMSGSEHEAEDLVQETCVRVLARPRRVTADDELGYLLGALRNVFLNERRGQRRRLSATPVQRDVAAPRSAEPDRRAEQRAVYAAIAALPPEQRDAVVAVDVVGLRYDEAARLLDCTSSTLGTRLYRARARLADSLS
jgi:RNA polymerase sigma-70 factor, ECF subfamily